MLTHFSHVRLFATPWTVARQASLSMGFSRQGYWSVLPYTLGKMPGDLPNPGIELTSLMSPALACRFSQTIKNLPAMQETPVQSLGQEDLLEKGMASYSSILAWRVPGTEESGRLYSPWGHKETDTTEQLTLSSRFTTAFWHFIKLLS